MKMALFVALFKIDRGNNVVLKMSAATHSKTSKRANATQLLHSGGLWSKLRQGTSEAWMNSSRQASRSMAGQQPR